MTTNHVKHFSFKLFIVAAILSLFSACRDENGQDPIVGDWEAVHGVYTDRLSIDETLEGSATIWVDPGNGMWELSFDIEVEVTGDREYELDMRCLNEHSLSFEMDCEMNDDGDELECEGDNTTSGHKWKWKLD